jgi:putative FmdB family regulatory protein
MPTYDYQCLDCGHTFEAFQMMSDKPLRKCPECRGKIKRLLGTGAGLIFKGSGFYETDYKRTATSSSAAAASNGTSNDKTKAADSKKDSSSSTSSKTKTGGDS